MKKLLVAMLLSVSFAGSAFAQAVPATISKSFSPSTVVLNGSSIATITVTNPNAAIPLTNVQFSDTMPTGIDLITQTGGTCSTPDTGGGMFSINPGTETFSSTSAVLAGGQSCTITVSVRGTVIGSHVNTTSQVTAGNASPGTAASGTLTVTAAPVAATITKAFSPSTVVLNGSSVATITVTNPNAFPITNVQFNDTMPAGIDLITQTGGACSTQATGGGMFSINPGTETFSSTSSVLTAGQSCTITVSVRGIAVGAHVNTTSQVTSPDAPAGPAASGTLTVNKAATNTVLTASPNPSAINQPVTFTATVTVVPPGAGTPTGTATFKDGATTIGTGTLNGNGIATFTTSTLSVGTHSITVVYGADTNVATSTSSAVSQVVGKTNQTIAFGPLSGQLLGSAPFTVNATASSTLPVAFSSLSPTVCSVTGDIVTLEGLGTCTIAADQAGNGNYEAAPRVTQSFNVVANCSVVLLSPAQLPAGFVSMPYSQALTLTNGAPPVTLELTGSLPPGVMFTSGVVSGTPTTRGTFPFTVSGSDANGCEASASYSLAITAERRLVVSTATGGSTVRAFNLASGTLRSDISAFGTFAGGASVAQGDVDGNGVSDMVVGAGAGGGPVVTVFDGASSATRLSFFAFDPALRGGVDVAAGDVTGDGLPELLVVGGCDAPAEVRAFDGRTGARVRTYALTLPSFSCGLHVAAGDVNGDGIADLVVGAGIGASYVEVIDGVTGSVLRELYPFSPAFRGGVSVAAGDVNGDGLADLVAGAGPGGTPHVRVFDGTTGSQIVGPLGSFHAYTPLFNGGARVGAGDLNGDGRAEVITGAGPGGGPHVRVWDGASAIEIYGLYGFDPSFAGGVVVAGPTPMARMAVDIAARTTGTNVRIAGWALREIATDTVGTDAIHAWAYPVGGGAPVFVGAAEVRVPRPDVAAAFGGEFLMAGFDFSGTLAPGTYDLIVYARNSRTRLFDQARVIRVTVP